MNSNSLSEEIHSFCTSNANEEVAQKSQRYFKEEFNGYGLTTTQITQKVKDLLNDKSLSQEIVLDAISKNLILGKYEELAIGLLLLNGFSKQFSRRTFEEISRFFAHGIHNWAHADVLGMYILPQFLLKSIIKKEDFASWLGSQYKFQRRCVPVTFIKSMKKDKLCREYINFVEPLMLDAAREVHQGIGWFLREAWKIDRYPVEQILEKYKETAPRLIFQYACEKMTAEEKLKFKRTKSR